LKRFWGTVDLIATLLLRACFPLATCQLPVVASSAADVAATESLTKRLVAFIVRQV